MIMQLRTIDVGHRAEFDRPCDYKARYLETFTLAYHTWAEMGKPDWITVSVEAGDLLNGKDD